MKNVQPEPVPSNEGMVVSPWETLEVRRVGDKIELRNEDGGIVLTVLEWSNHSTLVDIGKRYANIQTQE